VSEVLTVLWGSMVSVTTEWNNKQINSNEQIRKSITVCDKLFNNGNNLVVYGYIKGFQEALEYTKDK
jgi:hypothetical protein